MPSVTGRRALSSEETVFGFVHVSEVLPANRFLGDNAVAPRLCRRNLVRDTLFDPFFLVRTGCVVVVRARALGKLLGSSVVDPQCT